MFVMYVCYYLITVQLKIQISLVSVQTDVAFFLHILVTHGVVCDGICNIKIQINYLNASLQMKSFKIMTGKSDRDNFIDCL